MKYTVEVDDNGTVIWFKYNTNISHRENGPAVEYSDGSKEWYKDGKLHREDGPAVELIGGHKEWHLNGECYSEEEFLKLTTMKQATFRVIRFPKLNRFIAVAWNYDHAVLISTTDHDTYTNARAELDRLVQERNVQLKWFDGEYDCDSGNQLVPVVFDGKIKG